MTIGELAATVIDACEAENVDHMVTGAFAYSLYGIARSTKDVDVVLSIEGGDAIARVVQRLDPIVRFDPQVQFDTLTWGKRQIGVSRSEPAFKVELFELFDDAFVRHQFDRRLKIFSHQMKRSAWLPTAEDVVVQKLRWGRSKDLDDARDVLAVQGPETLDMDYIRNWCRTHGTIERLETALAGIPPL